MKTKFQKTVLIIISLLLSINITIANDDLKEERKIVDELNRLYNKSLMELDVDLQLSLLAPSGGSWIIRSILPSLRLSSAVI